MPTNHEEHVHIGDIWRENSRRFERLVRVISLDADGQYARIQTCNQDGVCNPMTSQTRAKLSRFGKGYVRP